MGGSRSKYAGPARVGYVEHPIAKQLGFTGGRVWSTEQAKRVRRETVLRGLLVGQLKLSHGGGAKTALQAVLNTSIGSDSTLNTAARIVAFIPLEPLTPVKVDSKAKVVLLGGGACGKSSLILRYTKDTFSQTINPTIGAAFFSKQAGSCDLGLDVWDPAGQARYRSFAPMYYRQAKAVVLVADSTSVNGLNDAEDWIQAVTKTNPLATFALVTTKVDCVAQRQVSVAECQAFSASASRFHSPPHVCCALSLPSPSFNSCIYRDFISAEHGVLYFETSAKTGVGVEKAFEAIAMATHEKMMVRARELKCASDGVPSPYLSLT